MNTDQKSVFYAMETSWVGVLPTFRALSEADKRDWLAFLIVKIRDLTPKPQTLDIVEKLAALDITVLLQGETGTGKELVARAIHCASLRCSGPFLPVNCGGIPDSLITSEMFAAEQGAFTGAFVRIKPGFSRATWAFEIPSHFKA